MNIDISFNSLGGVWLEMALAFSSHIYLGTNFCVRDKLRSGVFSFMQNIITYLS